MLTNKIPRKPKILSVLPKTCKGLLDLILNDLDFKTLIRLIFRKGNNILRIFIGILKKKKSDIYQLSVEVLALLIIVFN